MSDPVLSRLADTIRARADANADASYTRSLLDGGPSRCAKKLGEEAVETVIAAIGENEEALKSEAADLIYHLLVVLQSRGVAFDEVLGVLEARMGTSGHEEKARRSSDAS